MSNVLKILREELDSYRHMYNLELKKAKWLDDGNIDEAIRLQQETDALMTNMMQSREKLNAILDQKGWTRETLSLNTEIKEVHQELVNTARRVLFLNEKNQKKVRALMYKVAEDLQAISQNRFALKGYRSDKETSPSYLDGKI